MKKELSLVCLFSLGIMPCKISDFGTCIKSENTCATLNYELLNFIFSEYSRGENGIINLQIELFVTMGGKKYN